MKNNRKMPMKFYALGLFLVLNLVFDSVVGEEFSTDRTPFCEICSCENQTATNPDVNCSGKLILPKLFQEEMWFDRKGDKSLMYSINSVNLANLNMGDLKEKFIESNLKKLDLSRNGIKTIADNVFENLEDMIELILSHNDLQYIQPHAFMGLHLDGHDYPLRSLKILRLNHNNIHTLDDDVFQHIERHIEELYLDNNPLKVLDQTTIIAITGIQKLKILDLSYTQITNLPDNFLHTPKHLLKLDLTGNKLELIPKTLVDSQSLQELIMDNNPIKELTIENGFPTVTTLEILHMCNMPNLTKIGPYSLSGLENLEELYITNNNKLNKIDHHALVRIDVETYVWPTIKTLDLSSNKLTHLNYTFLGKWQSLQSLDMRDNSWTCECENQWMLDEMMPIYLDLNTNEAKEVRCSAPLEMAGFSLFALYERKSNMRCLDVYGNRPEKDGTMLVGMLIGILLGIPCILFVIYAYQRNWFGLFDNSPASYSRQFYKAPSLNEEF